MPLITLTTDFGPDSPYVAEMKASILAIDPQVRFIDITHSVPPLDVRRAAMIVCDVCPRFPAETIHMVVVDPGVGTSRKLILARIQSAYYLAPDNGVLSFAMVKHPPTRIVSLQDSRYWNREVSATFHGRDILSPVAAHLGHGKEPLEFGPEVSMESLVKLEWPRAKRHGPLIEGCVLWCDSFGNAVTNITGECLKGVAFPRRLKIAIGTHSIVGLSRTYGDLPAGSPIGLVGSTGRLEIAIVGGSAATKLGVKVGDTIKVIEE